MGKEATSTTEATAAAAADSTTVEESNAEGTDQGVYAEPGAEAAAEESTTEEQKGEETEASTSESAEGDEAEKPPETYTFSLPEGMELDEDGAAQFQELGKELGLTQAQADKLIGVYANRMQQQAESGADALMAQAKAQSQTWREETLADTEIGESGLTDAGRAVERFGSDSLKKLLDESGMGNHPDVVRFCMRVGKAFAEDSLETGTGAGAQLADNVEERGIYATS